jgi:phosphoglycolate phosphatase
VTMPRRALLLDLDGTLTDPKLGITNCIRHALSELALEAPDADALHWCIGPPLLESFRMLAGDAHAERALALYRTRFGEIGMFENTLYDGMTELVAREAARGRRIFLATSKPHVYAKPILEHFGLAPHFAGVYGSELDGTRVDKCELLHHIVVAEGLDPAAAIMVGARRFDIEAARAVGALAVWADWGYGDGTERAAAAPDHICRVPAELGALLRELP